MIRVGSRTVKPKLYSIAVLTGILVLITVFLIPGNKPSHVRILCAVFSVYFFLVFILLVRAFRHQLEYNLYSHNLIYYGGFALFVLSVFLTNVILTSPAVLSLEEITLDRVVLSILHSPRIYMILSLPFITLFSIALCISNISLIRHEGLRLTNLLGILLAVVVAAGWGIIYRFDYRLSGDYEQVMLNTLIRNILSAVYLYLECLLIGTIAADTIAAAYEPKRDKDFLVILGCGICEDGTPTPLLKGRIDRALAFYRKQKKETGKELCFITSGGQGPDEVISESESMKRYLMEQGIPEAQIIKEDRSRDTLENMKFSRRKIMEINPEGKAAFSTTNYHVYRSGGLARKCRLYAYGMGAETKWYFWPNAAVREFIGLLHERPLRNIAVLLGLIAAFVILTLIVYL